MSERAGVLPGGPSFGERRLAEETRERFMREIVARVPLDRLAAVHLFRPMRQGGIESGLAVIAAEPPAAEPPAAEAPLTETPSSAAPSTEVPSTEAPGGEAPASGGEAPASESSSDVPSVGDAASAADVEPGADAIAEPACDPTDAAAGPAVAGEDAGAGEPEPESEPEAAAESEPAPDADVVPAVTGQRPTRHTVFTARYRLTIKGPDRGKWDVEVVEEADAPLVTVEAVVRGVQRRAGDEADPERLDAAGVARLVGAPPPRAPAAPPP